MSISLFLPPLLSFVQRMSTPLPPPPNPTPRKVHFRGCWSLLLSHLYYSSTAILFELGEIEFHRLCKKITFFTLKKGADQLNRPHE